MRLKMETENKQENMDSWADQQQASTRVIIATKAAWFF